jgi:hypothetical protein
LLFVISIPAIAALSFWLHFFATGAQATVGIVALFLLAFGSLTVEVIRRRKKAPASS